MLTELINIIIKCYLYHIVSVKCPEEKFVNLNHGFLPQGGAQR